MAKTQKNGNITRPADRFYDYLTEHRGEVLRYMTAALVTGILQLILNVFLPSAVALSGVTAFFIRFVLLFLALKALNYALKTHRRPFQKEYVPMPLRDLNV